MQTSDPLGTSKALMGTGHTVRQCRVGAGGLVPTTPATGAGEKGGMSRRCLGRGAAAGRSPEPHCPAARPSPQHPLVAPGCGVSPQAARTGYGGAEGG